MPITTKHYIELFSDTFDGEPSFAKSLMTVLNETPVESVYQKTAADTHSIYEIVSHVLAWRELFLNRLQGDSSVRIEMNSQQDWPPQPNDHSRENWDKLLNGFRTNQQELINTLEKMQDEQLEKPYHHSKVPSYVRIESYLHHEIYHIGQIALLKNIFKTAKAESLSQ